MHMKRHGKFKILDHEDAIAAELQDNNDEVTEDDDNVYVFLDSIHDSP